MITETEDLIKHYFKTAQLAELDIRKQDERLKEVYAMIKCLVFGILAVIEIGMVYYYAANLRLTFIPACFALYYGFKGLRYFH